MKWTIVLEDKITLHYCFQILGQYGKLSPKGNITLQNGATSHSSPKSLKFEVNLK